MKGHHGSGWIPVKERARFILFSLLLWGLTPAPVQGQGVRFTDAFLRGNRAISGFAEPMLRRPAESHYDVVALKVEFQSDSTRFTTGDGTFDGVLFEDVEPPLVDPLPHDHAYFEAHLSFLRNYIRRVSDGRTQVSTHLLPKVVRVSGEMLTYSPTGLDSGSDTELAKLAGFIRESWSLADISVELPPGLDPERTVFVIFHAGVGRDIELLGTTLDKTPGDLPSLFFDDVALARLLGSNGLSVSGFPIRNTLLIPRTETRRGVNFIEDRPFLVEFSINGMLSAGFLNYLGAPDLFDTVTGNSVIGPFGVMDGLGIFAYAGLLPPEPSAWTKMYLGWGDLIEPEGAAGQTIVLRHSGDVNRNEMFFAPISEAEFFLVENRNRDPEGDGVNLSVWKNGATRNVHFENGDSGFNSASVSGFPGGVVVDADNFDFSLPGGKDEDGNLLNGGILIWHVDERALIAGLPTNSVNTEENGRAIDLEEADGAQDIGFQSQSFLGPSFGAGSPFDFFYEGNPVSVVTSSGSEIRLYQNRFGSDTVPNSRNVGGGLSFVELSAFSVPAPEMRFVYRIADADGIRLRDDLSCRLGHWDLSEYSGGVLRHPGTANIDFLVFTEEPNGEGALVLKQTHSSGCGRGIRTALLPAAPVQSGDKFVVVVAAGFMETDSPGPTVFLGEFSSGRRLVSTTTPLVRLGDGSIYVGGETNSGPALASLRDGVATTTSTRAIRSLAALDGLNLVIVYGDGAAVEGGQLSWSFDSLTDERSIQAAFGRDKDGLIGVVPDVAGSRLFLLQGDGSVQTIFIDESLPGELSRTPVLADLDRDGLLDVLLPVGRTLLAFNRSGAIVPGFPLAMRASTSAQPLVAELSDSGAWSIVVAAVDGRVDAYDLGRGGRQVEGFPLSFGAEASIAPVISDNKLAAISSSRDLRVWEIDAIGEAAWPEVLGEGNASFIMITDSDPGTPISEALLVPSETYNWPNPVREGSTWIRFLATETCDVRITIVDMAGTLIETLERRGVRGGVATEIPWTTSAGSGIYLARVTATTASGASDTRLIKMAIIR